MLKSALSRRVIAGLVLVAGLAAVPACQNTAGRGRADGPLADRPIVLDGRVEEWPARVATTADEDYIYFRVAVEGQEAPLQASPESLTLLVDLDARGETGARLEDPAEAGALGADLIVEFSPRSLAGARTSGVVAYAVDEPGLRTRLGAADVGLIASPTFGAPVYEIRVSRHVDAGVSARLSELLASRSQAVAMYTLTGEGGEVVGWSDPERFSMPTASAEPPRSDVAVPAKPEGAIRVLSYNVLRSALVENPSPFARVIQVVQPDVILLQEWDVDEPTARAWFTSVVTGEVSWQAAAGANGVVIVSPHPMTRLTPESIMAEIPGQQARDVRAVAAVVHTPWGDVGAVSTHLKCCGTAGSPEDVRRIAEARAISGQYGSAIMQAGARFAVVGGDLNLVGSRAPLDALVAGMDVDGSALAVAEPFVMGDAGMFTWRDAGTAFPPGRLDYIMYSDSTANLANAFVVETARLTESALARMGLDRTDTAASDHLPVVVDLMPR